MSCYRKYFKEAQSIISVANVKLNFSSYPIPEVTPLPIYLYSIELSILTN